MLAFLACAFALTGISAYVLTALARQWAPQWGLLDLPDGNRKTHLQPIPLLGGLAIFLAVLFSCGAALLLDFSALIRLQIDVRFIAMLLISGAAFCALGLYDDKYTLRARDKLLLQVVACLPFAVCAHSIEQVQFLGATLYFGYWGIPFTIIWLISCVNVVNLIDGMDGLASTICLIVAIVMTPIAMLNGNIGIATLSVIYAGAISGFLTHNWPPAKIFLGDAGSLLLGFLAGALSIGGAFKTATGFTLVMPLVMLSVPFFDTFLAIVRRKLKGQQISRPDRCHIHHQLQDRGLSSSQTLLVLSGICLLMGTAAVVSAFLHTDLVALLSCISILAVLVAGRVFARQEAGLFLQHVRAARGLTANLGAAFRLELLTARLPDKCESDWLEMKEEIQAHVAEACGIDFELTFRNQQDGHLVSSYKWLGSHEASPTNVDAAIWHVTRSQLRVDDYYVTMSASGDLSAQPASKQLAELIRLLDVISQHWPADKSPLSAATVVPFDDHSPTLADYRIDETHAKPNHQKLQKAA